LRRAGWAALTLFFVLAGCFAAVRLTGSPVDLLYGDGATLEQIAELEREWGLDRPLPFICVTWGAVISA
jgi:ABC-type dipeptide/oligopeptide/nickel transport system permease component